MDKVALSQEARKRLEASRKVIEDLSEKGEVAYGVNTGFGALKDKVISKNDLQALQKNLIQSHAVGFGDLLPVEVVRAALLASANGLSKGFSGVRPQIVERLLDLLNKGVVPCVPEKGSLGASGDLAPLSHSALVLLGEGEAFYKGEKLSGADALLKAGIPITVLEEKEGLALNNGTAFMTGIGALAVNDAIALCQTADIASAMSLEALMGTDASFEEKIHSLKPHAGQGACAKNMRFLTQGSEIIASHENCGRLQDAYSLRCIPQVHGASRDAISYAKNVVETELNSVTDNPLVFSEGVLSGGNFHGQSIALAMDFLAIAVAELGNISERRVARLVDPKLNEGLPAFLVKESGLNSGYMMLQYTSASLVSENKGLCHPASVDSIPTSANQEDHVSMGMIAARKARKVVENVQGVLAIELLCASQALDFRKPLKPGLPLRKAHETIRSLVPSLVCDRVLYPELRLVTDLVKQGDIARVVKS